MRFLAATLIVGAAGTGPAHACRSRQAGMDAAPEDLVASAREIYVARVVQAAEAPGGKVRYDFTVVQRLAGPDRDRFGIDARSAAADDVANSPDHSDERFWQAGGGRLGGQSNWCYVTPRFDVGMSYLVFLDRLGTYRGAERIKVLPSREPISDDKWYHYVVTQLQARSQR